MIWMIALIVLLIPAALALALWCRPGRHCHPVLLVLAVLCAIAAVALSALAFGGVVSDVMTIATALGALVFVVAYSARNWRASAIGMNVMALMVVILLVSSLAVSTLIFGRVWPARDLIRALSWALIAGTVWWRTILLLWTPNKRRQCDPDLPRPSHPPDVPVRRV